MSTAMAISWKATHKPALLAGGDLVSTSFLQMFSNYLLELKSNLQDVLQLPVKLFQAYAELHFTYLQLLLVI